MSGTKNSRVAPGRSVEPGPSGLLSPDSFLDRYQPSRRTCRRHCIPSEGRVSRLSGLGRRRRTVSSHLGGRAGHSTGRTSWLAELTDGQLSVRKVSVRAYARPYGEDPYLHAMQEGVQGIGVTQHSEICAAERHLSSLRRAQRSNVADGHDLYYDSNTTTTLLVEEKMRCHWPAEPRNDSCCARFSSPQPSRIRPAFHRRCQLAEPEWGEKAGLRRDAIRSQVIDAFEAQEIKETGNEEG